MDDESDLIKEDICSEYIADIKKMIVQCYDITLLDFIYQLLQKSIVNTVNGDSGVA